MLKAYACDYAVRAYSLYFYHVCGISETGVTPSIGPLVPQHEILSRFLRKYPLCEPFSAEMATAFEKLGEHIPVITDRWTDWCEWNQLLNIGVGELVSRLAR